MARIAPQSFEMTDGRQVLIRSAEPDDALAMIEYCHRIFTDEEFFITVAGEFQKTEEEQRAYVEEHCNEPGWLFLVAECEGALVAGMNFENGKRQRIAHAGTLGISCAADFRDCGLGTRMLEVLIDWARENPLIERLDLAVFDSNARAIHVYENLGFKVEGRGYRTVKFADGHYGDDIWMGLWVGAEGDLGSAF